MVWSAWIISYGLAAWLYFGHGIITLTSTPTNLTIYTMVFVVTMLAAIFRLWQTHHPERMIFSLLFVANFAFGWMAWLHAGGYFQAVIAHLLLHLFIAFLFIQFTKSKVGAIASLLMCLNVVFAALELSSVLPARPRGIFTGFHYPDLISYASHLLFVITGLSCFDGGSAIRSRLLEIRGSFLNENFTRLGGIRPSAGAGVSNRRDNIYFRDDSNSGRH